MGIPKLGEPLDTDTVPDTVLEAMEVTELDTGMDTESNFYTSNNLLPFILIIPTKSKRYSVPQKQNQILFRHVSSKVEEEFLKWQTKEYLKISYIKMCYISTFYTLP